MFSAFVRLVNMSITASILVAVVLLLRLVLKRAPRRLLCALWIMVGLRLLCPFSISSAFSAYRLLGDGAAPSGTVAFFDYNEKTEKPMIEWRSEALPGAAAVPAAERAADEAPRDAYLPTVIAVWLAGVGAMLAYAALSYLRLRRRVAASLREEGNIFLCDGIGTPFILGIVRPRIYLPSGMEGAQRESVLAHERAHLARRDHVWKPLGFVLLTVYWFNPVIWLAYVLLCRDIELACDERVIRDMGKDEMIAYSEALLACAMPRRMIAACPLAFGEVGVKTRIKTVLNYKRPAFWLIAAAVLGCIAAAVCFLTDPRPENNHLKLSEVGSAGNGWALQYELKLDNPALGGRIVAERWCGGACVSASPLYVNSASRTLGIRVTSRHENGVTVGMDVQLDGSDGSELTYFPLASGRTAVGWSFTGWEKGAEKSAAAGDELILAALVYDFGEGVLSCDPDTLLREPERLANAEEMIVIRAVFGYDSADSQGEEAAMLLSPEAVERVTVSDRVMVDGRVTLCDRAVTAEQTRKLLSLLGSHGKRRFPVGADDPNDLSLYVMIECRDGSLYQLHYQYYSGFSFSPKHPGEDDYRSILTKWGPDGKAVGAWEMDREFDAQFSAWYRAQSGENLTLDEVLALAEKGEALAWDDFSAYESRDVGSGLYILRYEIDADYFLLIGGVPGENPPMYIYLCHGTNDDRIDIRTGDVAAFVAAHSDELIPEPAAQYIPWVTWDCIYHHPYSSVLPSDDDGNRYLFGNGELIIERRSTGDSKRYAIGEYTPFTQEDWERWFGDFAVAVPDISPYEGQTRYYDLTERLRLVNVGRAMWLMTHSDHGTLGSTVESIYALTPEEPVHTSVMMQPYDPLEAAIHAAVMERNSGRYREGKFACESHVVLGELSGTPAPGESVSQLTVFALVMYQEYDPYRNAGPVVGAGCGPVRLSFEVSEDGAFTLTEYWEPRDGAYYAQDIRANFPKDAAEKLAAAEEDTDALGADCDAQYEAWLASMGGALTDARIAALLETICASPAASSDPSDYIAAHGSEYQALLDGGDATLRYVFGEFLKGGQSDLRGHIMEMLMRRLIAGEDIDLFAENGQAYFDAWRGSVERMYEQNGADYVKKFAPKGWMLLQMQPASPR